MTTIDEPTEPKRHPYTKTYTSTMCVCGENRQVAENPLSDNMFVPHTNYRTGEPCTGIPLHH